MPTGKKQKMIREIAKKTKAMKEKLANAKPKRIRNRPSTGNPIGRPSLKNGIELDKVYNLCLLGLTNSELAAHFQISEETFVRYYNDPEWPDFCGVIKQGREEADAVVTRSMFRRANGFSHEEEVIKTVKGRVVKVKTIKQYPPDTQAGMYWLNNRQRNRWRNKIDEENSNVAPSGPVVVNIITDEDTKARLLKLEQESNRGNVVNDTDETGD